jgi:hypothetical protein
VFDQSRYGTSAGGGARKHGGPAPQLTRVSQRSGDQSQEEPRVFVLGGNGSTLAIANSFAPSAPSTGSGQAAITARLVPLAWTPAGIAVGETWQNVGVALNGLFDWIDRTFPPEDERAFVAPMRDIELLARTGWTAPLPDTVTDQSILNIEDVPEEILDGLSRPPTAVVQCATCRRLCVRDEFVWKEKQLCAWDYHAQVFGKRGPWHNGEYEERHFETLAACAYVAPPLLGELGVEVVLTLSAVSEEIARSTINVLLGAERERPHLAVRTESGFTVLREA